MNNVSKEKLFELMCDLIMTLKSPNFQSKVVQEKWLVKRDFLLENINLLSKEDFDWCCQAYEVWATENI